MPNFIDEIKNYTPTCEQEEAYKKLFLDAIEKFDDVLVRENKLCHFCSSAFIINKEHTKVLCIYHNIYNSWGWVGGHADGDDHDVHHVHDGADGRGDHACQSGWPFCRSAAYRSAWR